MKYEHSSHKEFHKQQLQEVFMKRLNEVLIWTVVILLVHHQTGQTFIVRYAVTQI